ncbi:MAG: 6-phosphofructokinase [Eubacteriaceae bacterium]|nr:6-phosphofructokinase [Eubacteriaceae bacterium]
MMRIALLTSGGDSPGMNAAIRAVVRECIYNDIEVFGVKFGYQGLIDNNIYKMNVYSVADIIQRGGTILKTSRCMEMYEEEGVKKAADTLKANDINNLIVIGGDGSYKGARSLAKYDINVITIPGTIDNDVACTDYSIGFDTAVNTVVEAISKIRDTSLSHNRASVVEVMGRNCGNLAISSGLAGGAEAIIVPEREYDLSKICEKMIKGKDRGKLHSIIVFAEGAGDINDFASGVEGLTGLTVNVTDLGYIQRGGSPTAFDRILAARMGSMAVELLKNGEKYKAVCYRGGDYVAMDLDEALSMSSPFDEESYEVAMHLSI